ncbi:MAG: CHAD domain-containing protein [Bacteroidota bacterium]
MTISLDDFQRSKLVSLISDSATDTERQRNAKIVLAYADGAETQSLAALVGLSESRTRYWRGVFEKYGMDMFSPGFAPAVVRSKHSGEQKGPAVRLDAEARDVLRQHIAEETDEDLRRRMTIVLAYAEGRNTGSIAAETGLSESRTRFWRKAFERDGLALFDAASNDASVSDSSVEQDNARPGIQPEDSFAEAGRKVLRRYFTEMLKQEAHPEMDSDPEVVHKMRVATRRLRSAFEIFDAAFEAKAKNKFAKPLRQIARALGHVRDLDVLLENMRGYSDALLPEDAASFAPLLQAWEEERLQHYTALRTHLSSDAYQRFRDSFSHFVETPGSGAAADSEVLPGLPRRIGHIAPVLILERYTDILAFEHHLPLASIDLLHRLRIQSKKLRYTMECFAELLGPGGRKAIRQVIELQDYLGELQDGQAASDMITDFVTGLDARQSARPLNERLNPAPLLNYLAGRESRKHELMLGFAEAWSRFQSPDMRKRMLRALLR